MDQDRLDVALVSEDQRKYEAHKVVLSASSMSFRNLLLVEMSTSISQNITWVEFIHVIDMQIATRNINILFWWKNVAMDSFLTLDIFYLVLSL